MLFELDGVYYSDTVARAFGENLLVPGVGLTVVFPLNDYVRERGVKIDLGAGHE